MPIHDVAAMNVSLDNDYGGSCGAGSPGSHYLALFWSDPMLASDPSTVELNSTDDPGYGRVAITNDTTWSAADGGQKGLAAGYVTFPAPTDAWVHTATYWGLYGADDLWWDVGPLIAPLVVTSAGDGPTIAPVIFYSDNITG